MAEMSRILGTARKRLPIWPRAHVAELPRLTGRALDELPCTREVQNRCRHLLPSPDERMLVARPRACDGKLRSNPGPSYYAAMELDPTVSNPAFYKTIFENERVRVLEYKDRPSDKTTPHAHPDSVMYILSSFKRRLSSGGRVTDVELQAGSTRWLSAQEHSGENIGETETHVIFVELKERPSTPAAAGDALGPEAG